MARPSPIFFHLPCPGGWSARPPAAANPSKGPRLSSWVVGRLVQQQQPGASCGRRRLASVAEQQPRERDAHLPAAAELGAARVVLLLAEAQPREHGRDAPVSGGAVSSVVRVLCALQRGMGRRCGEEEGG
eukprot:162334-Chlamydomonas_euryale.AAC.1